ncbi:bile acid:sodium symporter family protein [Micromonospora sp. ALFpr18c]|uniref:bile acid:sodium symporter family protein n=1 Tax=Micromonospora sp. ALFpr18c TaxID=1458665 RepID=UPI00124BABDF|nr:bile acid:sodium symporter family protein [Micromonospora sp. ALFpr18c]KAB1933879.1 bile acid:sodium symporter family protein [Micromonospora sp. ALFpr18c]
MTLPPLAGVLLPLVIAVLMFGLGTTLTLGDFTSALRRPRALVCGLVCQLLVLPVLCFGLVVVLDLPPELAVGMMLIAASPGGTTASLFSHLARGDVALNITMTAVNTVLSVVTLPVIVNLALAYFQPADAGRAGLGAAEVTRLLLVILLPVVAGLAVRARSADVARRLDPLIRVVSVVFLVLIAVATVLRERDQLVAQFGRVGLAATLFCLLSLTLGYAVPRLFGVDGPRAVAVGMDVGVHNSGLAVTIALDPGMLGSSEIAIPGVIYAMVTVPCAGLVVWLINRRRPVPARV